MRVRNDPAQRTPVIHIPLPGVFARDQAKAGCVLIHLQDLKEEAMSQISLVSAWGCHFNLTMARVAIVVQEVSIQ